MRAVVKRFDESFTGSSAFWIYNVDKTSGKGLAHPPSIIYAMLIVLMLVSSLLAGDRLAEGRSWVHMVAFALTLALVLYVVLDLEFPGLGFVRLDAYDQVLVDVRESMK